MSDMGASGLAFKRRLRLRASWGAVSKDMNTMSFDKGSVNQMIAGLISVPPSRLRLRSSLSPFVRDQIGV
jgi:hypothetical protein